MDVTSRMTGQTPPPDQFVIHPPGGTRVKARHRNGTNTESIPKSSSTHREGRGSERDTETGQTANPHLSRHPPTGRDTGQSETQKRDKQRSEVEPEQRPDGFTAAMTRAGVKPLTHPNSQGRPAGRSHQRSPRTPRTGLSREHPASEGAKDTVVWL